MIREMQFAISRRKITRVSRSGLRILRLQQTAVLHSALPWAKISLGPNFLTKQSMLDVQENEEGGMGAHE